MTPLTTALVLLVWFGSSFTEHLPMGPGEAKGDRFCGSAARSAVLVASLQVGWSTRRVEGGLAVLRQADAFVTHAGMGGSQEGPACGVPMVAVPQATDQFGNAETLQRLGVARVLPKERADAQALREAVLHVATDPATAAASAALKAELAAEGGPVRAADLIEAEACGVG